MPKAGFVIQRYGPEITGGSESLCRQVAERLADQYEIEILTTCATDHLSWENTLRAGESDLNGVRVRRFRVREARNLRKFHELYDRIFLSQLTSDEEHQMLRYQGPYCPDLIDYLRAYHHRYDAFLVFTYMYYPAVHALSILKSRAAFIPTVHDEASLYLHILDEVFHQTPYLLFNTEEERFLAQRRFNLPSGAGEVAGSGIDAPEPGPPDPSWEPIALQLEGRQVLTYIGRIENGKGCDTLVDYFLRFIAEEQRRDVVLLMLGQGGMRIEPHDQILAPGYVSEGAKYRALEATTIAVAPSPYESLCLAALESWIHGRPLLVNGKCSVLVGHCSRSDGGLWYTSYPEFREALRLLLRDPELRKTLAEQGRRYVEGNYGWESILAVYRATLDRIIASRANPRTAD